MNTQTAISAGTHRLSDAEFDALFTTNKPVIFAYHGYPWTIHRLTYRRRNHANIHVRGYNEEGTTTTPFDMTVLNGLDRFHLVQSALDWLPELKSGRDQLKQLMDSDFMNMDRIFGSTDRTCRKIRNWRWMGAS